MRRADGPAPTRRRMRDGAAVVAQRGLRTAKQPVFVAHAGSR
jgi:hypothetical protein